MLRKRVAAITFFILFFCLQAFCQSLTYLDSLQKERKTATDPIVQKDLLFYISQAWSASNFDSAYHYGQLLYHMSVEEQNIPYINYSYNLIGAAFDYASQGDSARKYYQMALEGAVSTGERSLEAAGYLNLGALEVLAGNYGASLPFFERSIAIYETLPGNIQRLNKAYNNLGVVYRRARKYKEAIGMYVKAFKAPNLTDDEYMNLCYNMATAYQQLNLPDSAALYYTKMLALGEKRNDNQARLSALHGLGVMAIDDNRLEEGLLLLREVADNADFNDKSILVSANGSLGWVYAQLGDWPTAERYIGRALSLADEENLPGPISTLYQQVAEFYELKGEPTQALAFLKKHKAIQEKLLNETVIQTAAEWEGRFQAQQKEKELMALRLTNEEAALFAQKQLNERNLFLFLSVLLLGLVGASFFLFQNKKRSHRLLEEKNRTINKALADKELLMKEIHHRVKNNLQVVSSLLNLQGSFVKDSATSAAMLEGRNRVHSMALIHQKLYLDDELTAVDSEEYFEQLIGHLEQSYQDPGRQIEVNTDIDSWMIDVDEAVPLGLIVNELVTNAFKYAFEGRKEGVIEVKLEKNGTTGRLTVADNGIGMKTPPAPGNGSLGMLLIHDLGAKLKAKTAFSLNDGTSVTMEFPLRQKR